MRDNNQFKMITKSLFTLERKSISNSIYIIRSLIGIIQLIPFSISYLYFRIKYLFIIAKKVDYVIGCIDVQANIIKIKEILGSNCIAVNLRIEMQGKRYSGYWDIKTFDSYDYNFKNQHLSRLIKGPILFAKLLNISDKFIYVGTSGFFIPYIRVIDYILLKLFKKDIFSFFVGCDARARIPMTKLSKELNISVPCNGCSLICEKEFRKLEADIHTYFNKKIFSSIDQTGYITNYQSFDSYSFPTLSEFDFDYNFNLSDEIYIIHAASNPHLRGSNMICPELEKLNGKIINGRKIKAKCFLRIEKNLLIEEMKKAHIYINTTNGLIIGLGSAEAMAKGCILITGTSNLLNKDLPESYPGLQAINPAQLNDVLLNLIHMSDSDLLKISKKSYEYAMKYHHSDFVRENLINALHN
jgi:hypothetical protein